MQQCGANCGESGGSVSLQGAAVVLGWGSQELPGQGRPPSSCVWALVLLGTGAASMCGCWGALPAG